MSDSRTIIALSTPYQISAIHVIRISGVRALSFLKKTASFGIHRIKPRHVYHKTLNDFRINKPIDQVICFYFNSPYSYTGEDMIEIQCHGSVAIVDQIIDLAQSFDIYLAKEGEFTQRAFLNGKLDIDQAQAVDSLIRSKQSFLRENSLKILTKQDAYNFDQIRSQFIKMYSKIQMLIEFPDDDLDIQQENDQQFIKIVENIDAYLKIIKNNYKNVKKRENGIHLVLVGEPNVGKSTFMNFILGQNRSIVDEEEGTTRDYIKERFYIDDMIFWLYDTAGLREGTSHVEQEGIAKTLNLLHGADFLILLLDGRDDESWFKEIEFPHDRMIVYLNKSDILSEEIIKKKKEQYKKILFRDISLLNCVSNVTGDMKKNIFKDIMTLIQQHYSLEDSQLSLINDRQYNIVTKLSDKLDSLKILFDENSELAIIAEELEEINVLLDDLLFKVNKEEIFDELFRSFCIGK